MDRRERRHRPARHRPPDLGPVTYAEARAAGIPRRSLQGPDYLRIARGLYIPADPGPTPVVLARAALKVAGPHAFVSHHLAAGVHGGAVPHTELLHVSVPQRHRRSSPDGLTIHVSGRTPVWWAGVPLTSPADTFLDLASHLDLVDLVVLGDSLVRAERASTRALVRAAETARGRGARRARRAAAYVRAGTDSVMETRARMLLVLGGLPEPVVNLPLTDPDGIVRRRLDLAYPEVKVAVEYDGRQHAESRRQWEADVVRREELAVAGWRVLTVLAKDVYRTPGRTLRRVHATLVDRGGRPGPLREDWRRHFPDRAQPF